MGEWGVGICLQKYGNFGAVGGGFCYMGREVTPKPRASLRRNTLGGAKKRPDGFVEPVWSRQFVNLYVGKNKHEH